MKAKIAKGLFNLALAGLVTGYALHLLNELPKNSIQPVKAVSEMIQHPEKAFQSQSFFRKIEQEPVKLIDSQQDFKYELPERDIHKELCEYYTGLEQCKGVIKNE